MTRVLQPETGRSSGLKMPQAIACHETATSSCRIGSGAGYPVNGYFDSSGEERPALPSVHALPAIGRRPGKRLLRGICLVFRQTDNLPLPFPLPFPQPETPGPKRAARLDLPVRGIHTGTVRKLIFDCELPGDLQAPPGLGLESPHPEGTGPDGRPCSPAAQACQEARHFVAGSL